MMYRFKKKLLKYPGVFNRSSHYLRILTYHSVADEVNNKYNVSKNLFEEHIKYLFENQYKSLNIEDILSLEVDFKNNKYVIITFDDGFKNNIYNAVEILKKYDYTATFFITTSGISDLFSFSHNNNLKMFPNIEMMNWNDIIELDKCGFEIGAHSHTHKMLTTIKDLKQIKKEIWLPKKLIEDKLGKEIVSFSYPYGHRNSYTKFIIDNLNKSNYKIACTQESYIIKKIKDYYRIPRIGITKYDNIEIFKNKIYGYYDYLRIMEFIL